MNRKRIGSKRLNRRLETKRERAVVRSVLSGARPRVIFGDRWNHRPKPPPIL